MTRLELSFHDIEMAHATGFLYGFGQDLALVSNWHVFSGRHPATGIALDDRRIVPNGVRFHVTNATRIEEGVVLQFIAMDLPLT